MLTLKLKIALRVFRPGACLCLALLVLLALASQAPASQSQGIRWLSYDQILEQGPKAGKPVLLFFHAPWCAVCKKTQHLVFPDPQFRAYLNKRFLAGQVDVTKEEAVAKLYGINYLPSFVFLDEQGKPLFLLRGYFTSDRLLKALRFVADGHYRKMSFQAFEDKN